MDLSCCTISNTASFGLSGCSYTARLVDVHDGDTITVIAEVFPLKIMKFHVRLTGVDAPELISNDPRLKELAQKARMRVVSLLTGKNETQTRTRSELITFLQKDVHLVNVCCHEMDKYGRVLAEVYKDSNPHVGLVLLQEGLAIPYRGGKKQEM